MRIINEKLLDTMRGAGRCEYCNEPCHREPHHLWAKGMGGAGRLDIAINLIGLCRECYQGFNAGNIQKCDLLAIVAKREGTFQGRIERQIYKLLRTCGKDQHGLGRAN